MPTVTMPDGVNVSFPDDMPADQIRSLIAKKFPDAVGKLAAPEPSPKMVPAVTPGPSDAVQNAPAFARQGVIDGEVQTAKKAYGTEALADSAQGIFQGIPFSDELTSAMGAAPVGTFNAARKDVLGSKLPEPLSQAYALTRAIDPSAVARTLATKPGAIVNEYDRLMAVQKKLAEDAQQRSPIAYGVGQLGGTALVLGGGGAPVRPIPPGVPLPISAAAPAATLPRMMGRGLAAGAGTGLVYGAGAGEGGSDRLAKGLQGAAVGGTVGLVAPPLLAGIGKGIGKVASVVRGAAAPEREAARRVGSAIQRDAGLGQGGLTGAELNAAQAAGQPATVMDMGGEVTRAVARSAANTSPEGRAVLNRTIDDRFSSQGGRVAGFLRSLVGGTDASTTREALQQAARVANRPAYQKLYSGAEGKTVWSPELERLTSAPEVQAAMASAAKFGKNKAVAEGFGGFNPGVTITSDGRVTFRRGMTGVPTYPNIQYWDYVKQALDDAAGKAFRTGAKSEGATLGTLASQLRTELDNIVPAYAGVRAGAARFFDAQDALEAGQKFLSSNTISTAEGKRALLKMSDPEKKLFQEGFISDLIDKVNRTNDRANVVRKIFGAQSARDRILVALQSPQKARELEAFMKTEAIMDMARGAVQGNSTTARQLVEMGLAGGAYGAYTGDPRDIMTGALFFGALRYGAAKAGGKIDERVARRVAEMLSSPDPAVYQKGVRNLSLNPNLRRAMNRALMLFGPAAGAAMGGQRQQTQPSM